MQELFKTKPILSFIALTFGITFSFWVLPVIVSLPKDIGFAMILIGACGPLLAGLIITTVNSGAKLRIHSLPIFTSVFLFSATILVLVSIFSEKEDTPNIEEVSVLGLILFLVTVFIISLNFSNARNQNLKENYLKSAIYEKGKLKWYVFAFALLFALSLISYFAGKLFGLETTEFLFKPNSAAVLSFFFTFFFVGGNEEFGWRGFLQKELQKKYNPLTTSFVIYLAWTLWHLPLHYNGLYSTGGFVDLLPRFLWLFPTTIIYTWLYNKSLYALLSVMILHAVRNNIAKVMGSTPDLFYILAFLVALYCFIDGKMWKKKDYHCIYENNETN